MFKPSKQNKETN